MAELTSMQMAALQVLSWQDGSYLCSPDSSAFISQGIEDEEELTKALIALQDGGYVEFFTLEEATDVIKVKKDENDKPLVDDETGGLVPELDEDHNIIIDTITRTVDSGWIITDKGRAVVNA